jgi:hypothetical protein
MAHRPKRTEKTPRTGFKVPVPKRGEVLGNLDKIAKGGPPPDSATRRPKQ